MRSLRKKTREPRQIDCVAGNRAVSVNQRVTDRLKEAAARDAESGSIAVRTQGGVRHPVSANSSRPISMRLISEVPAPIS
jgi:hypothetical protein